MSDSINCHWIEEHLEAFYCDNLDQEQTRLARAHIESCESCSREVLALNAIDPLVKQHFRREMHTAQQPHTVHTGRVIGLSAASLGLVAVLLFVALGTPQTSSVLPVPTAVQQSAPVAQIEAPPPVKNPEPATTPARQRTKPENQPSVAPDRTPVARPATSERAPDFLVTDPAGYAHKLEDYRGRVVLVAVWSEASQDAISNLEVLYKTYGSNVRFRFIGVTNQRLLKPAHVTFPVFYNQGSKIFGARSGEFVLLDEQGGVMLRGSLVKDFDNLHKTLQESSTRE